MRVALMIEGQEGVSWQQWCDLADACEAHGIDTLFRSDHYISQSNESGNVAHDAWTTLAGLAARTTTLRFGTLVSPATFRLPGLLANAAATVDHISGGRIELGLGAGWMEREHRAYGFPFPETKERLARFAEQLEIVHRLWTDDRVDFHGTLLHARGRARAAEAAAGAAPADHRRRQRHARHSGAGGAVRRRVQHAVRLTGRVRRDQAQGRAACAETGRTLRYSTMTGCLIGETRDDALGRAKQLYGRVERKDDFDTWLDGYSQRALIGSVDEVAERLREYAHAGCEGVMLQHLLHADLEPVALIGRLRQQLV